jgi:hypothetical protein
LSTLKGDIVSAAFSRARISGLTKQPSPSDIELALDRLEDMAAMWKDRGLCAGYFFEDQPNPNTPHNLSRKHLTAFKSNLAMAILADFGKQPMPTLVAEASGSLSALYASTEDTEEIQYPSRMPIGSGNSLRWFKWRKFFPLVIPIDPSCETIKIIVGDIKTLTEHFDSYLLQGEDISSFTIEESPGLNITASSNTLTDVNYTIEATEQDGSTNPFEAAVKIVVTTTDGRITTRLIAFEVTTVEI